MSIDPNPIPEQCSNCGKASTKEQPCQSSDTATNAGCGDAETLCGDCASAKEGINKGKPLKLETIEKSVLMNVNVDAPTAEPVPTTEEPDNPPPPGPSQPEESPKRPTTFAKAAEPDAKPQRKPVSCHDPPTKNVVKQADAPPAKVSSAKGMPAETDGKEKSKEEVVQALPEATLSRPTKRGGKITRSSINGTPSMATTPGNQTPTIMKRLRKSTRATRFKAKLTGRSGVGGNGGQANGYNGSPNGPGSTSHPFGTGSHTGNTKAHGKTGAGSAGGTQGARNRRAIFKRPVQKTPKVQACTKFVKSVFYKGSYMQIGDIVSIVDGQQKLYYAQIRGLLVDAYCEKSAFLTWLIPTQDSPDPQDCFDPATYLIGPDEELSRKLCFLEFVMHAPSNYYYDRSTPFPLPDIDEYTGQRSGGYIWTRLPVVKRDRNDNRAREPGNKSAAS
ncbi:cell surface glycoprotein 1 [Drosophila obscura]|uniref:cell surface glycoprotein 1 n=1 Tax=Drosophila obscura TaxID=7282 RepID=UPI001BB20A0C|nr:cell surface glycoprotein 1 [Drosophila obscura]